MGKHSMKMSDSPSCTEIFQTVNARQISALMFHDQMADYFDFLGLMGFKRMHEYQYLCESAEHRTLKRYYINHHNKLLVGTEVSDPKAVPDDWCKYTRFDVTGQVRTQAVKAAFDSYRDWECETKDLYEECAKALFDMGNIADFNKLNTLVCDVDMELKTIDRLYIKLCSVGFNDMYIASIQDELHEHYREKTKEIGIDIC